MNIKPLSVFSSTGVSAFPHIGGAPGSSSSLWPSAGLSSEVLCLSGTEDTRTEQMWTHHGRVEENHLPRSAGRSRFNASQDATGLLCHKSTLLPHGQHTLHQDTQVNPCRASLQ